MVIRMTSPQLSSPASATVTLSAKAKEHDELAKAIIALAPVLAMIIKANVPEAKDIPLKELIKRIKHHAIQTDPSSETPPANLENNEIGHIRADIVITVKISEGLYVRINVEAQNKPHPGYSLGNRVHVYGAELTVEQYAKGWISGSNYDGLRKMYSIWLISNGPKWAQGRVFRQEKPAFEEVLPDGKTFVPENAEEIAKSLGIRLNKFVFIAAYLPDLENKVACADWVRMLGTVLSTRATEEQRTQALRKNGIVVGPDIEEKVKKMCSLSEGLIQAGRDEMAPVIAAEQARAAAALLREAEAQAQATEAQAQATEAQAQATEAQAQATEAQARANDLARIAHALISHPGWSMDNISRDLDMPVERVRDLLSQNAPKDNGLRTLH